MRSAAFRLGDPGKDYLKDQLTHVDSDVLSQEPDLKSRCRQLFNQDFESDIVFVVGKPKSQHSMRIPAHKFIVKMGSPVLFTSLSGNWAESDEVIITDFDPSPFLTLLRFMYMDEIVFELKYLYDVLAISKKYMVDGISGPLTTGNQFRLLAQEKVWSFLMYSVYHSDKDLIRKCWKYIDDECENVINQDDFYDLDDKMLEEFLSRDSLKVHELNLWNACLKWASKECSRKKWPLVPEKKRAVMEQFLHQIRLPLLSAKEFGEGPAESGILTDKEVSQLFKAITLNKKDSTEFSYNARASKTDPKSVNWSHFICTYILTGKNCVRSQHFYRCMTCNFADCCVICVHKCHQGHNVRYTGSFKARFCDCGFKRACMDHADVRDYSESFNTSSRNMMLHTPDDLEMEEDDDPRPNNDTDDSLSTIVDSDEPVDDDEDDAIDFNDL